MSYSIGKQLDRNEITTYMMDPGFAKALHQVIFAVAHAERQHPIFPDHPQMQISILTEEVGEAARCANNIIAGVRTEGRGSLERYRAEILDATAVTFRILMNLEDGR